MKICVSFDHAHQCWIYKFLKPCPDFSQKWRMPFLIFGSIGYFKALFSWPLLQRGAFIPLSFSSLFLSLWLLYMWFQLAYHFQFLHQLENNRCLNIFLISVFVCVCVLDAIDIFSNNLERFASFLLFSFFFIVILFLFVGFFPMRAC